MSEAEDDLGVSPVAPMATQDKKVKKAIVFISNIFLGGWGEFFVFCVKNLLPNAGC